ncbi:MAG: nucleotidyl transferase AbiEii/AbiGii toxin family protein [Thermodesulfobacteriota bacterium]|nr:nucleotidyl transferase AbiEii/AbiGii toxin family protein [Thermodesulfobacteriota bacterium]
MIFNDGALIHNKTSFERDTLDARYEELQFNNLARMELFLWDMEMFLQIQDILKEKVVLKGGAAAQFYLPVEFQRTSVDIDMICSVTKVEIKNTLGIIETKFNGEGNLFKAREHKPKKPKTDLPMFTYYMGVPSVCTKNELFGGIPGSQEIKIEFHISEDDFPINAISSPAIFAVETDKTYQILPLNTLLGDKLTTLGPNTIGIPQVRSDEQIKQIYDIASLIEFNGSSIDYDEVRKDFISSAKLEAKNRGLTVSLEEIFSDMLLQMERLSYVDMERDEELIKLINDFQSLYVRKSQNRSIAEWAMIGAKIRLLIDYLRDGKDVRNKMDLISTTENSLQFHSLAGADRGKAIRMFKNDFSLAFEKQSRYPAKILKGKNPMRMVWAVVSKDNLDEVTSWVDEFIKQHC